MNIRSMSLLSFLTAAIIAAVSAMSSTTIFAQEEDGSIALGFLMPLTGGAGHLGQMMMQGSALAVDEINEAGGIRGRELVLIAEDSRARSRQGVDGLRKLVDVDGAHTIITGWTTVVAAVAPIAERQEVFLISASTASPALRGISPYFQSTWMFDDETVRLILPYAKEELGVQRLGLLTVQTDLGLALSESINAKWAEIGGELVREEGHQVEEMNFRPSLLRMLSRSPDAIYITSPEGEQAAQIIRQARELGYQGLFLSFGAIEDPVILELGSRAEGMYYTSPDFNPRSDRELTSAFAREFEQALGRLPNVHQANHYDLVYMFKAAADALIEQGEPVSGENVRNYFRNNIHTYQGSAGDYVLNYSDGSVRRSTIVKTVKDSNFVTVAPLDIGGE